MAWAQLRYWPRPAWISGQLNIMYSKIGCTSSPTAWSCVVFSGSPAAQIFGTLAR